MDAFKPKRPLSHRAPSSFASTSTHYTRSNFQAYQEVKASTPTVEVKTPKEKGKRHQFRRTLSRILGLPKEEIAQPIGPQAEVDDNPAREYLAQHPYAFDSELSLSSGSGSQGTRGSGDWTDRRFKEHPNGELEQPETTRIHYAADWCRRDLENPQLPAQWRSPPSSSRQDYAAWNKLSARLANDY